MLDYNDFWLIADNGNKNWKGNFSPREVANNAYDYKVEYDYSIEQGKPTRTMYELCKLIIEDMNKADFKDLDISTMEKILEDYLDTL